MICRAISDNHRFSSIFVDFRRFSSKFVKIDKNPRSKKNIKKIRLEISLKSLTIITIVTQQPPFTIGLHVVTHGTSLISQQFPVWIISIPRFSDFHRFSAIIVDFHRFSSIFVKIIFLQDCCSKNENGTQKSVWQTSMTSLSFRTLSKCRWRCFLLFARKNQVYAVVFPIIDENRWKSMVEILKSWSE